MSSSTDTSIVQLSAKKFLGICAFLALAILFMGASTPVPPGIIAVEVLITILLLFVLGSIRYRLDKNALTYGAAMVIVASFWTGWWPTSQLKMNMAEEGPGAFREEDRREGDRQREEEADRQGCRGG